MQEPRTTVRLAHRCRAQYCPTEALLPTDGYITDLSERGVGLLTRGARRDGERITVSFSLPGEDGLVTATGVVQWAETQSSWRGWHPVGMAWLPLEETTRQRLQQFLSRSIRTRSAQSRASRRVIRRTPVGGWRAVRWGIIGGLLVAGLMSGLRMLPLQQPQSQLQAVLRERNATIHRLEQETARLRREVGVTQVHLRMTSGEVDGLSQQTQALEGAARELGQDVARVQASHVQLSQERDALIGKILELEQERALLLRRSIPLEELQLAIREAIALHQERTPTPPASQNVAPPSPQLRANGNRGHLIQRERFGIRSHESSDSP